MKNKEKKQVKALEVLDPEKKNQITIEGLFPKEMRCDEKWNRRN